MIVTVDDVLQVEGADYAPANQVPGGGNIAFMGGSIPSLGSSVVITRSTDLTQEVVYTPFDPFPAKTHEGALDKLTLIVQELAQADATPGSGLPLDPTGVFWDALSKRLKNLINPVDPQDAATKAYADSVIGEGFDPSVDQDITGSWSFSQPIAGVTLGNVIASDLVNHARTNINEVITGQWTFADGASSQRKPAARNPRQRSVIANDVPVQADEGAILRVDAAIVDITLQVLEPETTFTILAKASGFSLLEGSGVTINFLDGLGAVPPSGNRFVARSAVIQIQYEDTGLVNVWGNGLS